MTHHLILTYALLFGLLHGAPPQSITKTYGEGGWILKVRADAFTRQTMCELVNRNGNHPDVTVAPGALSFHFKPKLDTYGAWYTVDHGAPQAWRDQSAALIHIGAMAQAERLDNSTGGVVVIPMAQLTGASLVEVRPTPRATPKAFRLASLWKVIASADGLGCGFQNAHP